MSILKSIKLTPATITGILLALISTAVAFGAPLTAHQSAELLVLGNSVALVLFAHGASGFLSGLTPQTVTGLVTTLIGVAISFGLPITHTQSQSILALTGVLAGLLLVHGTVKTYNDGKLASLKDTNETLLTVHKLQLAANAHQPILYSTKAEREAAGFPGDVL